MALRSGSHRPTVRGEERLRSGVGLEWMRDIAGSEVFTTYTGKGITAGSDLHNPIILQHLVMQVPI